MQQHIKKAICIINKLWFHSLCGCAGESLAWLWRENKDGK